MYLNKNSEVRKDDTDIGRYNIREELTSLNNKWYVLSDHLKQKCDVISKRSIKLLEKVLMITQKSDNRHT